MSIETKMENIEQVKPVGFREYIAQLGPSTIVTMVICGPATIMAMLGGGSILGPKVGWMVVLAYLGMWWMIVLAGKTTTYTGKPALELLGDSLWKHLVLIFGLIWLIPQVMIVMVQGTAISQTGAALLGIDAKVIVWPLLILTGCVFYLGTFPWLRNVASILISIMAISALMFGLRLLLGPELPLGEALLGLIIPYWPDHPHTASLFASVIGSAGTWGVLAYQGYAIVNSGKNKPEYHNIINWDGFFFGFLICGIFALGFYWAAAGVFHSQGVVPKTASEAATLFMPILGDWSYPVFYIGFLSALFTTLAGTNILATTCLFAILRYYKVGNINWDPVIENKTFKIGLFIMLFIVAGLGALLGKPAILPFFLWALNLLTVATPPALAIWIYFTNNAKYVGPFKNSWYFNIGLAIFFVAVTYVTIRSLPSLLNIPFIK